VSAQEHLVVAMPALYRPEILGMTLWSFNRGLFCKFRRRTLILNVDPLGDYLENPQEKQREILQISRRYFNDVIYQFADTPSFPAAVKWIWQHAVNYESFFLHLEDDWVLNRSVPPTSILHLLGHSGVASVRLQRQRNLTSAISPVFSLNPIFFKSSFIAEALEHFDLDRDPEKQFLMEPLVTSLTRWRHLIVPRDSQQEPDQMWADRGGWVSDIGVHWRKSRGLEKKSAAGRTTWTPSHASNLMRFRSRQVLAFKLQFYRLRTLLNGGRASKPRQS